MPLLTVFLLALSALSATGQTLSIVSGNGLIVQESFPAPKPFRVRATNASGAGVASHAITWSVKQGEGQLINIGTQTDADGYATADFFGTRLLQSESYATAIVNATSAFGSVDFVVNTVATRSIGGTFVGLPQIELIPPTGTFSGPAGTVFPQAFGINVKAQAGLGIGQGIPYVGVRMEDPTDANAPYARCGPDNIALTDAQGIVYCDLVLGNTQGTAFLSVIIGEISQFIRRIPVTVTAGTACSFAVSPATQAAAAAGATHTVGVTVSTGTNCSWTAASSANWITITSGGSGTGAGTVTYTVAANTGVARSGTLTIAGRTVTVNQAAAGGGPGAGPISFVTTSPLPGGTVGSQYSLQLSITGGTAPFQWSATGTFPPGLGLTPTNGLVSGVPTTAGTFSFTIQVVDATGATASLPGTMTIAPAPSGNTLTITTTSLPNGAIGAAYQQAVTASGACNSNPFGGGSVNWTIASGVLPPGLALVLSGSSVFVQGTPTSTGAFNFSLRATDTCSRSDTKAFTITISDVVTQNPMIVTPTVVDFSVGFTAPSSPEQNITVSTGATGLSFTATTSTPWLSISPANGTTPGTIVARAVNIGSFQPGVYNGSIVITSGASNSPVTIPVTLRVAASANVTVAPESLLFRHTLALPISQQILNVGSVATGVRFFVQTATDSGGSWLSVSPMNGETRSVLSVTVNTTGLPPGTYNGTVRVIPESNAGGLVAVPVTVVVQPPSSLTVDKTTLTFNGPGSQSIAIGSTGTPVGFNAVATGGAWLTINPTSGTSPATIVASVNVANLAPGTYNGTIVITPSNSNEPIPVAVTATVSQGQPNLTAVTNAASFAPGSIAPGEIITLFGTNLGPATLVSGQFDTTGTLPTTLSDVRVLVDNVAAPLIYVASNQVSAIVPFGVFGRTSARLQVTNGSLQSNVLTVPIAEALPGIFVLDGNGQGAILNQDGSVNAQLNGAEPGSIIAIYATGAGQVDRQVFDGRVVTDTPFPRPLLPVGVRIGGRVADVTYAGAAPGQVAGMIQVNARIPADTPTGTPVPIQIIVGSATSQANVFLSMRP